jgi:cell division protease FtsH
MGVRCPSSATTILKKHSQGGLVLDLRRVGVGGRVAGAAAVGLASLAMAASPAAADVSASGPVHALSPVTTTTTHSSHNSNNSSKTGTTIVTKAKAGKKSTTATVTGPDKQPITVIVQQPSPSKGSTGMDIIMTFFPVLLIGGFIFFMIKNAGKGGPLAGMTKTPDAVTRPETRFKDVAGVEEAKEELSELVDMMRDRAKYTSIGAKVPKGVLLTGPPGTGKTLLARAVAGEVGASFYAVSASEFVQMFVGVGAARVRSLFAAAAKTQPAIIFIDEFDAIAGHRSKSSGVSGGHDEREQTLNQLLTMMDGFEQSQNVVIIAATNRPDVIDEAAKRSGRFDLTVGVTPPDLRGRTEILKIHTGDKQLAPGIDLEEIARMTPGMTGADLENVANQAAIVAVRNGHSAITDGDFDAAVKRVIMGPAFEVETVAYHEAGHAIVGHLTEGGDPIRNITIIPHGQALGLTYSAPEEDLRLQTREQLQARLDVLMAGREAEKIIHPEGKVTTGAGSDLERATAIALAMTIQLGLSDLGDMAFPQTQGMVRPISEATQEKIDTEVARLQTESSARARKVLEGNRPLLDAVAKSLKEHENVSGEMFRAIVEQVNGGPGLQVA